MILLSQQTTIFHQSELKEIHIMGEYVGVFHTLYWFKAYLPEAAPALDLLYIALMKKYEGVNPEVAKPCLQSLSRHEEYLTEELCILCLADENLPDSVREAVAEELLRVNRQEGDFELGKPKFPKIQSSLFWDEVDEDEVLMSLQKLVGRRSWSLFNILSMTEDELDWLEADVKSWSSNPGYKKFADFVKSLAVVNDSAERGVKLIQDFVGSTSDESLRQDMMLAVSDHRIKKPGKNLTKKTLADIV